MYRVADHCRLCGSGDLDVFLDLGMQALADAFVADKNQPEMTYPLAVAVCGNCGWAQTTVVVDPVDLYQHDYPYEASVTAGGRQHFAELAASAVSRFEVAPGRLAVDIGCNDGVLLDGLQKAGCTAVGIDPAENIVALARDRGFGVVPRFFDTVAVEAVMHGASQQAALITATNVFAHIDDLNAFMENVDRLLAPDGVLIIEAPHFLRLVEHGEYDTIYHEHLSYLTVAPLQTFFEKHGFSLFDVQQVGIHGGSVRLFVRRLTGPVVRLDLAIEEMVSGVLQLGALESFANAVHDHQRDLYEMVAAIAENGYGHKIAGLSAPAKGMTLINSSGIAPFLQFLTERSTQKIGRFAPGSRLEVKPDSALIDEGITHALILAWNFGQEIARNQTAFSEHGGQFLVPIPQPQLLVPA